MGRVPSGAPPVEAFVLIDNIVSDFETLANLRRNLNENLRNVSGQMALPTSLVFLTDEGLKTQGMPTRDPKVLLANLDSNPTVPQATQFSAGYDRRAEMRQKSLTAVQVLAADLLKKPGRRLLIWVSPRWAAFEAETSQKSAKERQELFNFIVGISTLLRMADVTLYSVDPMGTNYHCPGSKTYETQDYARGGNNQDGQDPMGGNNFKYKDHVKWVTSPKQADNGISSCRFLPRKRAGKFSLQTTTLIS